METVFRDVSHAPGPKTYARQKLDGQCVSVVQTARDLSLIDLSAKALRKLNIKRRDLIDSEAADYVNTRPWAEALHAQCKTADGLLWVSRQDDTAQALVLFGDRLKSTDLEPVEGPTAIVSDSAYYQRLQNLALAIGVDIIL